MSHQGVAPTLGVALALLSAGASGARPQTAQEIVDRHIKALGGARALRSVTSVRLSGTANGSGEFLWQTRAPSAYYLEVRHGDTRFVEAFNGKSAWRDDTAAGLRTLIGEEQARARATGTYRNDRFLAYKKDKTRLTLLGRDTVEGRPAHAVEVTTATGVRRRVFFDAQSYLILKEEQEREGGTEEILFSDYRAVDRVPEPHRIRIRRGAEAMELAVEKADHNASLAALFDFPRRDTTPLPDIASLFKQVLDNQNELEKAREDYAYTKTQNDIAIDDKGHVKERSERTYEVFHVAGRGVEQLVARNGQPLTPDEARREQARIENVIREHKKKLAEKKAREAQENADRKGGDDEDLTVSQILRVCQFVNPRRERLRGQEVVVYDYEPRPGEKPRGRLESAVQKMTGTVWIDEQARRIVRLEARVSDAIKVGGGLVLSVQRGSSFVFEQRLVNGEVWLPSYFEVNASARFLLVKGFKINQTQRFSDYKKFSVETTSEIKPPRP